MLLVHEDDQDLILGQAAPLSISTHPTAELVPTREMDNSRTNRGKKNDDDDDDDDDGFSWSNDH